MAARRLGIRSRARRCSALCPVVEASREWGRVFVRVCCCSSLSYCCSRVLTGLFFLRSGSSGGVPTVTLGGNRCSTSFGGTSAAAPLMAGVVALMLEANANLTYRDVQHVIANSATKEGLLPTGWTRNGAGFNHHHDFGFGRINAPATILKGMLFVASPVSTLNNVLRYLAAKTWVNVPAEVSCLPERVSVNKPIYGGTPTVATFNISGCAVTSLEQTDLVFQASHPRRGLLRIVLVSPTGTRSNVQTPHQDNHANYPAAGWRFGSVRNWGEDANGLWQVEVTDTSSDSGSSTFNWFQLQLYGFTKPLA